VGVVAAEDGVITLRVSCQKFLFTLDPLTLRLFSRLRQQQEDALQDALTAAAAAAAAYNPGQQQQQQPTDANRLALLQDIYNSNVPATLERPGDSPTAAAAADKTPRPAWHTLRGKASSPGPEELASRTPRLGKWSGSKHDPQLAAKRRPSKQQAVVGGEAVAAADAAWEGQLPAGLTADKCEGLPQTVSVRQLVEVGGRQGGLPSTL
jgi:hypothetical protein